MWKKLLAWILITVILIGNGIQVVEAFEQSGNVQMEKIMGEPDQNSLYARSAVLMDADSGRILYEKNGHQAMANASTTKILTCIIALEKCELDSEVTVSALAASQPKVHLGMREGQRFYLKDLLYGLMLESYNDCAVAIAEHIAGTTADFAAMMNDKAKEIGCEDSYFITPNGLDAKDEDGFHHTTAADLSLIMRYCIKGSKMAGQFLTITQEGQYQFHDMDGKNSYTCYNHNAFLQMMDGALSGKTGFTGNAGYCYIGALQRDDRTFIVALLACGWPNNKTYKWADAKKLMQYGITMFKKIKLDEIELNTKESAAVEVKGGQSKKIGGEVRTELEISPIEGLTALLIGNEQEIQVKYEVTPKLYAPVMNGDFAGEITYLLGDEILAKRTVTVKETVKKIDFFWCIKKAAELFPL
ncbi:D-alanyl-D-alanine carboxypeptidase [Roseburia sp. OF03-24]|uniref:D-alanyl-D-alanine carboxypeptidase family protein n=1 Tax=Roseburia sp. OF03-24 TaxID=2292367 RepID=UPI000E4D3CC6|nr:D-alanyl-D-alanine carboxypeptidase family protein [Roseburia sp. OF03-24]RGX92678.1 D-alanyl-D-alanine carboxypeptidase [Roseburia sp. OF03-24]